MSLPNIDTKVQLIQFKARSHHVNHGYAEDQEICQDI